MFPHELYGLTWVHHYEYGHINEYIHSRTKVLLEVHKRKKSLYPQKYKIFRQNYLSR